jgi:hypothetical protein
VAVKPSTTIKDRAIAAALQMKMDGEIPKKISQRKLSKLLAQRIGLPDRDEYIRKDMKEWGLWPVAEIKLPK